MQSFLESTTLYHLVRFIFIVAPSINHAMEYSLSPTSKEEIITIPIINHHKHSMLVIVQKKDDINSDFCFAINRLEKAGEQRSKLEIPLPATGEYILDFYPTYPILHNAHMTRHAKDWTHIALRPNEDFQGVKFVRAPEPLEDGDQYYFAITNLLKTAAWFVFNSSIPPRDITRGNTFFQLRKHKETFCIPKKYWSSLSPSDLEKAQFTVRVYQYFEKPPKSSIHINAETFGNGKLQIVYDPHKDQFKIRAQQDMPLSQTTSVPRTRKIYLENKSHLSMLAVAHTNTSENIVHGVLHLPGYEKDKKYHAEIVLSDTRASVIDIYRTKPIPCDNNIVGTFQKCKHINIYLKNNDIRLELDESEIPLASTTFFSVTNNLRTAIFFIIPSIDTNGKTYMCTLAPHTTIEVPTNILKQVHIKDVNGVLQLPIQLYELIEYQPKHTITIDDTVSIDPQYEISYDMQMGQIVTTLQNDQKTENNDN